MKIAILTPTYSQFSGIDKVVKIQARDFIKRGHQVAIFCLSGDLDPESANLIRIGAPKNLTLERIYRLFFFLDRKKINKYVALLKNYDLIISHLYPMNILGYYAKKRHGVKYIYHNHGIGIATAYTLHEKIYLVLLRFFSNIFVKNIDYSVAISKYIADCFKKETGLPTRKIIYDKIDRRMYNKKVSGAEIRKKYKIGKSPLMVFVGRNSPHKGVHLLIKAFKLVNKKIPEAKLIVVGRQTFPQYAKKLKKLAAGNKNITLVGFIPDREAPKYFAACDVYATASLWEGFNLTIAEANAMGKPVVAFDIGPHKEVLKNGILVKKNNVQEFADAIIKLLKHRNL